MTKTMKGSLCVEHSSNYKWIVIGKDLGGGELRTLTFDAIHLDDLIEQLIKVRRAIDIEGKEQGK